jgi:hypothetical protein
MFTADEAMGHGLADAVQSSREFYKALVAAPESGQSTARARLELERSRV